MRLALLLLSSCVSQIYTIGGTPGDDALACGTDPTCQRVNEALEMRRRNIGGWCGVANFSAREIILFQGPAALPYLARAFDDRDPEVAALAMSTAVQLGCPEAVAAWCEDVRDLFRIDMCRRALAFEPEHTVWCRAR